MEKILNQLTEYCDCIAEDVDEKNVYELIHLVSMATCWTQEPCDTFLFGTRKEVVDLDECIEDCGVFIFDPFYRPFDPASITFTLVEQQGIEEKSVSITDFIYSEVDDNFRLDLPIPTCDCIGQCTCGCRKNYKLVAEYNAGYEELPECLLPVFCEALYYIIEFNKCNCEDCPKCNEKYADYITYSLEDGASITDRLADFFVKVLAKQFIKELSLISLCDGNRDIWGFVV